MFLGEARNKNANASGQYMTQQMATIQQKRGIEKVMPFIVAASGLLTIVTLTVAITDRYKKGRGK